MCVLNVNTLNRVGIDFKSCVNELIITCTVALYIFWASLCFSYLTTLHYANSLDNFKSAFVFFLILN